MSTYREEQLQKEIDHLRQVLRDRHLEYGARDETLHLIDVLQGNDFDAKRKLAEGILDREYYRWVEGEVETLVDAIRDEEVTDYESLRETMEQNTDASLIYTHDQRMVIYCSNSVDDGAQEMEDMGGGGDNAAAVLALLTYQVDVREALDRIGLGGDFDREEWLEAAREGEYGEEIAARVKKG